MNMPENWWNNVPKEHWHRMTPQEWAKTHRDYKMIKPDGTKIVMVNGTLAPVIIAREEQSCQN